MPPLGCVRCFSPDHTEVVEFGKKMQRRGREARSLSPQDSALVTCTLLAEVGLAGLLGCKATIFPCPHPSVWKQATDLARPPSGEKWGIRLAASYKGNVDICNLEFFCKGDLYAVPIYLFNHVCKYGLVYLLYTLGYKSIPCYSFFVVQVVPASVTGNSFRVAPAAVDLSLI